MPWTVGLATALIVSSLLGGPAGGQEPAAQDAEGTLVPSSLSASGALYPKVSLTRPVERELAQIQERWIQWTGAFLKDEPELSGSLVTGLLQSARQLGLERLPDLSVGASGWALKAAIEDGDAARAEWALGAAERFDPGRPETSLARARVRRHQGRSLAAIWSELEGYFRTRNASPGDSLTRANVVLWILFSLLGAAGLFVALQMGTKGRALFADLEALLGRLGGLPPLFLRGVVVLLLLWPLLLQGGVLWLLLYWSALLIAYGSLTERAVILLSWGLVVFVPLGVAHEGERARLALSPAMRGLESVVEDRLHGKLFQDLEQLAGLLPEDPAVIQLMADLHRGMGQWDAALELYERVVELEPGNVWAWIDIGGYYFSKKDYGAARTRFNQALEHAQLDEEKVVCHYNLSQAYSEDNFLLNEARAELQRAQEIDAGMVSRLQRETVEERVATFDGGVARASEIRRRLARRLLPEAVDAGETTELAVTGGTDALEGVEEDEGESGVDDLGSSTTEGPLLGHVPGVLGAGILAIFFWLLRPGAPVPGPTSDRASAFRDAFVPGLASAREGKGFAAFAGLWIPLGLVTFPLLDDLAYPLFPAYGNGAHGLLVVAAAGLVLYFAARLLQARLG